jgi:hypothetical protein
MPLPPPNPKPEPTLEESKANIEAAVTAAMAADEDICEIMVPYDQSEELMLWVEASGLRCVRVISKRTARLSINLRLAPLGGE